MKNPYSSYDLPPAYIDRSRKGRSTVRAQVRKQDKPLGLLLLIGLPILTWAIWRGNKQTQEV